MILCFSGGLDSYIAWKYLGEPKTVYLSIHNRGSYEEGLAVKRLIPDTLVLNNLNLFQFEKEDADIPMRNAFLTMMASYFDSHVVLVVQKGEMSIPDRSLEFFTDMSKLLTKLHGIPVAVNPGPFVEKTKTGMVSWYKEAGHDINKLKETRSCYAYMEQPCASCGACFRRWVAMVNNDIVESYHSRMIHWVGIQGYIEKMKAGKYDPERTEETFAAFRRAGIKI